MKIKNATDDYVEAHVHADEMLSFIKEQLKHHYYDSIKDTDYGHVGDLEHVIEKLQEISDFLGPVP